MRCYGDKPPEFMAKVPSGLLPVLEVGGQIITESAVIQQVCCLPVLANCFLPFLLAAGHPLAHPPP